ncbi:MAG: hypothetical protein RL404_1268 [Pseudomonadota bacterium]
MNNLSTKSELRTTLIAARRRMPADVKTQSDGRIIERLAHWIDAHQVRLLGGYLAMAGEPELAPLYASLAERGVVVAMPVVVERHHPLRFVRWQPGDALARDASGTLAPAARDHFVQPDTVIAPCLGYTEQNLRLGYGGGYFDRTLAQPSRPRAVGVAYATARVAFAADAYDVPLDEIITD